MNEELTVSKLEYIIDGATAIGQRWGTKRSELTLDEKGTDQFVSNVDMEIDRHLRRELLEKFPGHSIIGEELGGGLSADQSGWAIDPIDGTSNFVLGLPLWAISVGYISKGESVLGAISLPDLNITLSAAKGKGMRLNKKQVTAINPHSRIKVIALGENDFETGLQTDMSGQQLRDQGFTVVRYRCAVFSLAMSALGRLSGYMEKGCGLWDIAAADVICREAGLEVQTARIADARYSIDARWAT